ncbi:MAG: AAA family ATPase [Ruthenibacterium lactatiformans]
MGLADAGKRVAKLSKGMRQRLILAMAVLHRPRLLFLDEPTAALDPATTAAIHRLLREMNDGGTTIFLTTHNMEEADRLCARVAFLNEGRIAETGVPAQLKLKYAKDRVRVLLEDGEALECARNPEAIGALLADLSGRGIASVHSEEPDLEEIFLQVTGRNLV